MILPIVAFGAPILRKKCIKVTQDYPDLDILIENMWETMYAAHGIGLAAPLTITEFERRCRELENVEPSKDLPLVKVGIPRVQLADAP